MDYESREKTSLLHVLYIFIFITFMTSLSGILRFNLYESLRCSTNFSFSVNISISVTESYFHSVTHFNLRPAASRHAQIDFSLPFIAKLCIVIWKFAVLSKPNCVAEISIFRLVEFFLKYSNKILTLFLTEQNTTCLKWSCTSPWTSR